MANQHYIEIKTGRRVKAEPTVLFDSIGWIVDYLDEPPVRHVYSDEDFKQQFMEVTMEKVNFTKEAVNIIEAITVYDSLSQSRMLLEEILAIHDVTDELKEKLEEIDNDLKVHSDFLGQFIFSNATFEE